MRHTTLRSNLVKDFLMIIKGRYLKNNPKSFHTLWIRVNYEAYENISFFDLTLFATKVVQRWVIYYLKFLIQWFSDAFISLHYAIRLRILIKWVFMHDWILEWLVDMMRWESRQLIEYIQASRILTLPITSLQFSGI